MSRFGDQPTARCLADTLPTANENAESALLQQMRSLGAAKYRGTIVSGTPATPSTFKSMQRRHPVARPRKEVPLPGLSPSVKWLLISSALLLVHLAVLSAFGAAAVSAMGVAWALVILCLSYLTVGVIALAVLRWLRRCSLERPRREP